MSPRSHAASPQPPAPARGHATALSPAPAATPVTEPMVTVRSSEKVTGILLAGGQSRRMGRDKAWVMLAGRPLVRWALDALRQASDAQIVVARDPASADRLAELGVPVVIDALRARGPLTGLHAGLTAAGSDLCVVLACDMPLARPELLTFLCSVIGSWDAAVPYAGDAEPLASLASGATRARDAGLHPLLAAYRRACLPALEKVLQAGPMPTMGLLSLVRTRIVAADLWREVDPDGRSFLNVNMPSDVVAAARLLAGVEGSGAW